MLSYYILIYLGLGLCISSFLFYSVDSDTTWKRKFYTMFYIFLFYPIIILGLLLFYSLLSVYRKSE